MLPNKSLLFSLLRKLAFTRNENCNVLGLEAQSISIFNEPVTVSQLLSPLLNQRYFNQQLSKSLASESWGGGQGMTLLKPQSIRLLGLRQNLKFCILSKFLNTAETAGCPRIEDHCCKFENISDI